MSGFFFCVSTQSAFGRRIFLKIPLTTIQNFTIIFYMSKFLFLFIILFLLSARCSSPSPPFNEVKKELDKKFPITILERSTLPTRSTNIEVYIDGSVSCAGFVTEQSKYIRFLKRLRRWGEVETTLRYLKFGAMESPERTRIEAAMSRDFYDQSRTRLVELISAFADRDTSRLPGTFLVITDGCQSHAQQDIIRLVRPTLRLINRGYHFQILGIRSQFRGYVYSEVLGGIRLGRYDSSRNGERPFYCFIFSTKTDFGKELKEIISNEGIECHLLSLKEFLEAFSAKFEEEPNVDGKTTLSLWERCGKRGEGVYLYWKGKPPGNLKVVLSLSDTSDLHIGSGNIRADIYCLHFESRRVLNPNCQLCKSSFKNPREIECVFSFAEVEEPGWSTYKIVLYPRGGTFSPPKWVEEWSTDTDTALQYFNRTLFLKEFVEEVINRRFENLPLFVIYPVVRGR